MQDKATHKLIFQHKILVKNSDTIRNLEGNMFYMIQEDILESIKVVFKREMLNNNA